MPTSGLVDRNAIDNAAASVCASNASWVVADEPSLHAAVAAAQPGDVIAISGMIALHATVAIETPHVTLTCASPGSGLSFASGEEATELISVFADNVAIRRLYLDARLPEFGMAIYSGFTDGQRTEFNTIMCGDACGEWHATTNAVVSDNVATAAVHGNTGLHFQAGIDGTRIERNTITALVNSSAAVFGAIRPRDGFNVVVSDNVIRGPWFNSISSVNLNNSSISQNLLEGARRYGLSFNVQGSLAVVFSRDNLATANRVRDAGVAGYFLRNACYNVFRGSVSLGSTPLAFVLDASTGANVVSGTAGTSVDGGAYDCDGDGVNDPNKVSGTVVAALTATASPLAALRAAADETRDHVLRRRIPLQ
jgi:hypothetical protein